MPDFRVLHNSSHLTAGTMSFTIPIHVSHKVQACKKECLINEKNSVFLSKLRATDLCVLHWGFPVLPLYLSIMEQTFHGFWRKILRKSYSSCFLILCHIPKVPTMVPWTQGDKQASPDGVHSPEPGVIARRACQTEQPFVRPST